MDNNNLFIPNQNQINNTTNKAYIKRNKSKDVNDRGKSLINMQNNNNNNIYKVIIQNQNLLNNNTNTNMNPDRNANRISNNKANTKMNNLRSKSVNNGGDSLTYENQNNQIKPQNSI